jgi:hypothetical protein
VCGCDVLRLDWVVGRAVTVIGGLGSRVFQWHGRFLVRVLDGGAWEVYSLACAYACVSTGRIQPVGFEVISSFPAPVLEPYHCDDYDSRGFQLSES